MKKNWRCKFFLPSFRVVWGIFVLAFFLILPEIFASSGGGGAPPPAPPSKSQPPVTGVTPPSPPSSPPATGGTFTPAGGGTLNGPTPYIFPVYPDEGQFAPEGHLTPLTIQVRIEDKLQVGITAVGMALDMQILEPVNYNPGTGIATATVSGLRIGPHSLQVSARDALGNLSERGWDFLVDAFPPPIIIAMFDGVSLTPETDLAGKMWILLNGAVNPATVGNPANWQVIHVDTGQPTTVTAVELISRSQQAHLTLAQPLSIKQKYHVTLSYGEGSSDGYYGYHPQSQPPGTGQGLIGGKGIGGKGGVESLGLDWTLYRPPSTPWNECECSPHPPGCDEPDAQPHPEIYLNPVLSIEPGSGQPEPPSCEWWERYWVSHFDAVSSGEKNWWCAHIQGYGLPPPFYHEWFVQNWQVSDYDLDLTHDLSWNGSPPPYGLDPPVQYYDDPEHPFHPPPPLLPFNQYWIGWGYPNPPEYPYIFTWPRGGPTRHYSRINYDNCDPCWVCPDPLPGGICGVPCPILHVIRDWNVSNPPDNTHPDFEEIKIVTGDERIQFKSRYAGEGIIIGQDTYGTSWNPARPGDRFIQVIAYDHGPGPRELNCAMQLTAGGWFCTPLAPLLYACGDRGYLSQSDPQYGRVIDRLIKTGQGTPEDWNHVCDYGMVNATYMIDEGANDVTPGNPPQELPYWGSPKWSNEPRSHDPDRSPWFEKAVWFIPLDGMRNVPADLSYIDLFKYFVRVDDNVGSWRISPPIDPNIDPACGSPCVEILKPTHTKQYVNLAKDQAGTDECGLQNPPQKGSQFCVRVAVKHINVRDLTIEYLDPAYQPPAGNSEPTNPGVAGDFGCNPNNDDNRAERQDTCHIDSTTPPGFICIPGTGCGGDRACTAQEPCHWVAFQVVGENRPQYFNVIFQTSTIGGDNYRIIAYDPNHSCTLRDWRDGTKNITVWRKYNVYRDQMSPDLNPDTLHVKGVFADGFIEMNIVLGTTTPHGDFLRQDDPMAQPEPNTWHGAGVIWYVHNVPELASRYQSQHPPNPLHSFQSQGADYLAKRRCTVTGYEDRLEDKDYGISLPWTGNDWDHSFVAVGNIRLADDVASLCHTEQGQRHEGDELLQDACRRFGVLPGRCINSNTLLPRTTVHELVHAVLGLGALDDRNATPPCEYTQDSSLMQYRCLYDRYFGGWASQYQIVSMRDGATTKN